MWRVKFDEQIEINWGRLYSWPLLKIYCLRLRLKCTKEWYPKYPLGFAIPAWVNQMLLFKGVCMLHLVYAITENHCLTTAWVIWRQHCCHNSIGITPYNTTCDIAYTCFDEARMFIWQPRHLSQHEKQTRTRLRRLRFLNVSFVFPRRLTCPLADKRRMYLSSLQEAKSKPVRRVLP